MLDMTITDYIAILRSMTPFDNPFVTPDSTPAEQQLAVPIMNLSHAMADLLETADTAGIDYDDVVGLLRGMVVMLPASNPVK